MSEEYNTKNYTEQNGERTVIGGDLVIDNGGRLFIGDQEVDLTALANLSNTTTSTTVSG